MSQALSVPGLIQAQAQLRPTASAILASGRPDLTYAALDGLIRQTAKQLQRAGIRFQDRVAMVLPAGPVTATAFLGVASVACAAPLNPTYRQNELEFYLTDLKAKAVIVPCGERGPAVAAARATNTAILELVPEELAGAFHLQGDNNDAPPGEGFAREEHTALVLHTSGTTSRPKIVPLSHANLCASARHVAHSLALTAADRCLNAMPLFHIHGLIGALLSSLSVGGSVLCRSGFEAPGFLQDLALSSATWYTAVPTMHQAILTATGGERASTSLRMIRSCSASLPPSVMQRLEATFGVPVVEAYGMTEAAHQMTCNPLPPRVRKPGSVGIATGVDVAIMDAVGNLLSSETEGEVVIRGASVTRGYEGNPQANDASFTSGWFRTGDQGRIDAEGYLYLTGRIKEIINRGGEKISPREIDEVLLEHPAVAQATAFALPHATLGEDVAAAVVSRADMQVDEESLRSFAAQKLSDFKVPARIVFVREIPKGPTGKLQRIGLAEKLGLTGAGVGERASEQHAPRGSTEARLAGIWRQLLGRADISRHERFIHAGGNSLLTTQLMVRIQKEFGVQLSMRTYFESDTIAGLAAAIKSGPRQAATPAGQFISLVPFQTEGSKPPLFMVHGQSGRSMALGRFSPHLATDQPFYGLVARGMDGLHLPHFDLEEMAAAYVAEIRTVQPAGPYFLSGFCNGGTVAAEMARQLLAAGEQVAALIMIDTAHPKLHRRPDATLLAFRTLKLVARRLLFRLLLATRGGASVRMGERIVNETIRRHLTSYQPMAQTLSAQMIRSSKHPLSDDPELGWSGLFTRLDVVRVPEEHAEILGGDLAANAGRAIQSLLDAARALAPSRRAA